MAHLTGVRGTYPSNLASQQNLTNITPERMSCLT